MSSILNALKKLEEEKALRREEPLDLPREILQSRREKRQITPFTWVAVLIASLLFTITITTLVVTRRAEHQDGTRAATETKTTSGSPVRDGSRSGLVSEKAVSIKAAPQRAAAIAPDPQKISSPASYQPPPFPEVTLRAENRTVISTLPSLPATALLPPTGPTRKTAPTLIEPVDAALTVSGIAWNKDGADRLAIINGQPLSTGSAVNGFIVEEILPDRVRFSATGRTIEVLIGKSGKIN